MIFEDRIHGNVEIGNPLLVRLIHTPEMERLKGIEMGGFSAGYFPGSTYFSRFEHSVGVMLLLARANASIEEQIFGLLHDVNHTVFSHAIDYALEEGSESEQNYQDRHFEEFLLASSIPGVLREDGLDVEMLFKKNHFSLAECDLPELCADRIDYSLRSMLHYGTETLETVRSILEGLENDSAKWFFADESKAARFATAFSRIDDAVFDSFESGVMYHAIGACVAAALDAGAIDRKDIVSTDQQVIAKIEKAATEHPETMRLWQRMRGLTSAIPAETENAISVMCKSRIVDPLHVADDGRLQRLSSTCPPWRAVVDEGMTPKSYRFLFID